MTVLASGNVHLPQSTATETIARETFQALLSALSNPGRIFSLPGLAHTTWQSCQQIGMALLDLETSFFTPDPLLRAELSHSGARALSAASAAYLFFPDAAAFAGSATAQTLASIAQAPVGSITDPDEGATLIVAGRLGQGQTLHLHGPGIQHTIDVCVDGLPVAFWNLRAAQIHYPLGIDLFIVDGLQVMGFPRTTVVQIA